MKEEVNEVLEARAHDPRGLNRTMTASFAVHIGMVVLFGVVLRGWISQPRPAPKMMTISLGVSEGPRTSGMTAIGGRPVEQVEPPPKRPEPIKPATPNKPEVAMNVPPKTKAQPESTKPVQAPTPPPAPKPTTGSQIRTGTSQVETGARGEGAGLSFGGGLGAPTLQLAPDFCCPVYADQILSIISRNWQRNQSEKGETTIIFTIQRDGRVDKMGVERSSGNRILDLKSISAIPPSLLALPSEYKPSSLTVHLTFLYGGS